MSLEFKDLLDFCQIEAISTKLSPTEASLYRSICRDYSRMFHTPLMEVLNLDPEHVILNVYEEQMKNVDEEKLEDLERIMDVIYSIEDPEYDAEKKKEQEDFDRRAEEEEERRVAEGRALHPSLAPKKTLSEKLQEESKNRPTGGHIDLSYLDKEDQET